MGVHPGRESQNKTEKGRKMGGGGVSWEKEETER